MTNTPSSEAKQLYECPVCKCFTAFKVPQVYESKHVKVDCYDMKCGYCDHTWLPLKEEARIDLEVRQALESKLSKAIEALKATRGEWPTVSYEYEQITKALESIGE